MFKLIELLSQSAASHDKTYDMCVNLDSEGMRVGWEITDCQIFPQERAYVCEYRSVFRVNSYTWLKLYISGEQDSRVVKAPEFGSKGTRFDPRQQPLVQLSLWWFKQSHTSS